MSAGGGPTKLDLGLLKCVDKLETVGGKVSVSFSTGKGSAVFSLSKEDADYFVVGEHYDFVATKP